MRGADRSSWLLQVDEAPPLDQLLETVRQP